MGLPKTVFVRRADVCAVYGMSQQALYKAVKAGVIHRVKLPGNKYGKYLRKEVLRVFGKDGE